MAIEDDQGQQKLTQEQLHAGQVMAQGMVACGSDSALNYIGDYQRGKMTLAQKLDYEIEQLESRLKQLKDQKLFLENGGSVLNMNLDEIRGLLY